MWTNVVQVSGWILFPMGYDWDIRQYKKDLPKIWKYYRHSCKKKKN